MKQSLFTFDINDITDLSEPRLRLFADQEFVTSTGERILAGSLKRDYREFTPTLLGTTVTVDTITEIDTTTDSTNENGTYSLYLCDPQGNRARSVFSRWAFPATFGTLITLRALTVYNENRVPLRDTETYSKNQINLLLQSYVNDALSRLIPLAQGRATLTLGTATVLSAAVAADSNIHLTGQDANVSGTPFVSDRVPGVSFTITSTNFADSGIVSWVLYEP